MLPLASLLDLAQQLLDTSPASAGTDFSPDALAPQRSLVRVRSLRAAPVRLSLRQASLGRALGRALSRALSRRVRIEEDEEEDEEEGGQERLCEEPSGEAGEGLAAWQESLEAGPEAAGGCTPPLEPCQSPRPLAAHPSSRFNSLGPASDVWGGAGPIDDGRGSWSRRLSSPSAVRTSRGPACLQGGPLLATAAPGELRGHQGAQNAIGAHLGPKGGFQHGT